jgi:hypothetical protein
MARLCSGCTFPALLLCGALASLASSPAQSARGKDTTLQAGTLTMTVHVANRHFAGLEIKRKADGKTLQFPDAFVLVMQDGTTLRSQEMTLTPASKPPTIPAQTCWDFSAANPATQVRWCTIIRANTDYLRQQITIRAPKNNLPITEVRLLQFADAGATIDGNVKGSPIVSGTMYYGFEHPLSTASVTGGNVTASLVRTLPLQAGQSVTYSSVIGDSQPGQLRRTFLAYLENERPRRYKPFLHYNSWFDLGYGQRFDEAGALDRINAFGKELTVKRNVQFDSFLFDDGWDDTKTLWGFNPGFPNGFTEAGKAAAKYHAGVGVWLSPWGGYDKEKKERIAYGRAHGYEIMQDGYALSGPKYYKQFEATCQEMIARYNVNQFKFDGTGNADRVFPGSAFDSDFDAALHLIEGLRKQKPDLFINLTTGTTASPFWLFYADSIWRNGEDHDFTGEGTPRQRWTTYRDAQTYKNIVLRGPLFPLNSLMLHGIVYARSAKDLGTDPGNDFSDEVHSFFGSGTQLQELYITPSLLSAANWDTLATAARWSRTHAETLKDTHWVGGDPQFLQVYGWAAWSSKEGILTLRNPSPRTQEFTVDPAKAFELPDGAATAYRVHSVWQTSPDQTMRAGQPLTIPLRPFEVVTFEAIPQ